MSHGACHYALPLVCDRLLPQLTKHGLACQQRAVSLPPGYMRLPACCLTVAQCRQHITITLAAHHTMRLRARDMHASS